uniref:CO_deh_flav_C domain-containing protein n=1 Tax=Macrostomum lignano TaxID=282301 RepID=A0A1I8FHF3_9PLAT
MAAASSTLVFYVNQNKIVEPNPDPEETLISYCGGSKAAAAPARVMLSRYLRPVTSGCQPRIENLAINACLAPLCSVHGAAVTTIEGIGGGGGGSGKAAHPIQERLAVCHGSQCGFCTPGMVMTAYALLRNHPQPTERQIDDSLQGNLCRCTGLPTHPAGAQDLRFWLLRQGRNCCRQGRPAATDSVNEEDGLSTQLTDTASFLPYDPSQEPIFPSELQLEADKFDSESPHFPVCLRHVAPADQPGGAALKLKQDHPDAKIINGNTEVGVEVKSKKSTHGCLIYASHTSFAKFDVDETGIDIGAAVTLTELADRFKELITDDKLAEHKKARTSSLRYRWQHHDSQSHFGSESAAHELGGCANMRIFCRLSLHFGPTDEALLSIRLAPFCGRREFQFGFKQARRREDDIAIVNAGMLSATVCFGGVGAGHARGNWRRRGADRPALVGGAPLSRGGGRRLDAEFPLEANTPGGQAQYRKSLCTSFFIRFLHRVGAELCCRRGQHGKVGEVDDGSGRSVCRCDRAGARCCSSGHRRVSWRRTRLAGRCRTPPDRTTCRRPLARCSSTRCSAGTPPPPGVSIDASAALALDPGVLGVLDRRDVPGNNEYGIDLSDDRIFADAEVRFHGETVPPWWPRIGSWLGGPATWLGLSTRTSANRLSPFSDAIREAATFPRSCAAGRRGGDVDSALAERAAHSCLVVPRDGGEFEVLSSTQNLSSTQSIVAGALGLPRNRLWPALNASVAALAARSTRSIGTAAVAAVALPTALGGPRAACWDRADDMMTTGTRHRAMIRRAWWWALKADCYLNAGYSADISCSVCEYIILRMANCYNLGAVDIRCRLCRTNTPSNTAFARLRRPAGDDRHRDASCRAWPIRELNFFRNGDVSIYGHAYEDVTLQRCWEECLALADYEARKAEVDRFNSSQSYRKRGCTSRRCASGIGFGRSFLQQAGALVNVYLDGSVLITHGGVEMGQGLHTKLLQVAARVLDLPIERLYISETATDKVPNTVSSAASMTTDLNAPAVMSACQQIRDRLLPYMHSEPKAGWDSWVNAAYMDGPVGRRLLPRGGHPSTWTPPPCRAGPTIITHLAPLEIDLLTGDHVTRRSDIVMDLGASLNPAVDIGQIEGAFVQGMGLYTLEEQRFSPAGELLTKGPGAYKIPGFGDIRKSSTCSCCAAACANSPGPCTPPRAWGSRPSVWPPPSSWRSGTLWRQPGGSTRAKTAIAGGSGFRFDAPATSERIRLGCADDIAAVRHAKCSVLPENAVPWELKLGH